MISMENAKAKKLGAVGEQFTNPKGAVGTIVGDLSPGGYPQARFICPVDGCGAKHLRKSDDWHTVTGRCPEHSANKMFTGKRPRLAQISPDDAPEVATAKQTYNDQLIAQRAERKAAKRTEAELAKWRSRAEKLAEKTLDGAVDAETIDV